MSGFDLSKVRQLAKEELEAKNSRGNGNGEGNKYQLVYPAQNGKLILKLLFNPKSNLIQRKIVRHEGTKKKVVCLQNMYGIECPICSSINQVEQTLGKEMGAWRKYGYKTRGICYAQIIDHEATYFNEDNSPKKGDTILFMYPVSVYDEISKIICDSGEHLEELVAKNEGLPIVVTRSQKSNGIPEYTTSVYPYGKRKSFEDSIEDGKTITGEEKFENLLNELPNLNESLGIPEYQEEKVIDEAKALGETIIQEYMGSKIVNPEVSQGTKFQGDSVVDMFSSPVSKTSEVKINNPENDLVVNNSLNTTNIVNNTANSNTPECYGNHKGANNKACLMCPFEDDCYSLSQK